MLNLAVSIAYLKKREATAFQKEFPDIPTEIIPVTGTLTGGRMYVVAAKTEADQKRWFRRGHEVWAAGLAAKLAQKMDLPSGNKWEPPAARRILEDLLELEFPDRDQVEAAWRECLGLVLENAT